MASVWTPLLETMGVAARRAYPFIQAAAAKGWSGTKILTGLKDAGFDTFRRQDFLALVREASGAELLKSDIQRWPAAAILPLDRVRASVTKLVAPFSYTLRVRAIDTETGEETVITRQAHSQTLQPLETIAARFMERAEQFEQYDSLMIGEAVVVDVQRAGDAGVL